MKRRLFLHIGLSKTGTTSIQSFLRENEAVLAAHGVNYPHLAGERSSHPALAPSVLRPHPGREVNHEALAMEIRKSGRTLPGVQKHTPLWSGVFERIEKGNAQTIIISYENFYLRPDLFQFDILSEYFKRFDVTGIIYLRPQEDWIISLYSQTVKGTPRVRTSLSDFMIQRKIDLRFSNMLDDVVKYLPIDHLIVGDFQLASSSGLLADFIEKTGLPHEISMLPQERAMSNRSMPAWATLFLLKCNQSGVPDEAFIKVRRALAGMKPDRFPVLRAGLDVATPEERERLRDAADADSLRLRELYGITLNQRSREPITYRPFDEDDVDAIRKALETKVPRFALGALDDI